MTGPRDRVPAAGLLTTAQIVGLGVPTETLRSWVHRGRLRRAGGSERYPQFRAVDVAPLIDAWTARQKSA